MWFKADEIKFVFDKNMLCVERIDNSGSECIEEPENDELFWEAENVDPTALSCK